MSRRSIDARCDRIIDRLLPIGSMQRREYFLAEHLRDALAIHRQRCAAIISALEIAESGSWYSAFLRDDPAATLPAMPRTLQRALGLRDAPVLTETMDEREIEATYHTALTGSDE